MSPSTVLVDALALVAVAIGFTMVFRQEALRRFWSRDAASPRKRREEDPAHYALIIFGMMLLAFGLIIFGFVTAYALLD